MPLQPDPTYQPPTDPWLSIVHEDERLLVVDKPSGLLTVPGKDPALRDSLEVRVQERFPQFPHAKMVHRLDRDTSGLLLIAFDKPALGNLGQQFETRRITKSYVARVWGEIAGENGTIDLPLATDWENRPRQRVDFEAGRQSRTEWQVIARELGVTRLRLTPLTGRTHQLRVHMLALGHPILGDGFYAHPEALAAAPRLQLHAETLGFFHPADHRLMQFTSPAPF
ncbi:MAG: RluA family pseudouridine synthase [Devosia sp.]